MIVCPACGQGPGTGGGSCRCRRLWTGEGFWTFSALLPVGATWRYPCLAAHSDGSRALWLEDGVIRPLEGPQMEEAVSDIVGTVLMLEVLGT